MVLRGQSQGRGVKRRVVPCLTHPLGDPIPMSMAMNSLRVNNLGSQMGKAELGLAWDNPASWGHALAE
jgi:hypothetical protein